MTTYDRLFFEKQSSESYESAIRTLTALFKFIQPTSMLDVGCGVGPWIAAAQELGVADCQGIDGDYVPLDKLVIDPAKFIAQDLSLPFNLRRQYDLVTSLEVAEHLNSQAADQFVKSLTQHGKLVLFSAAIPFQGGDGHLNENWAEYWAALFDKHGYSAVDILRPAIWHDPQIKWWYRQNAILFRARDAADRILPDYQDETARSLVHPEYYLTAIRRLPNFQTTQAEDLSFWANPTGPALGYGKEQDSDRESHLTAQSYSDLKSVPRWKLPPVLADAIAPIRKKKELPTVGKSSEHAPDFLGIGVQKGATTWLFNFLNTHPDVFLAPGKEMDYFSRRAFENGSAYSGYGHKQRMSAQARRYFHNNANLNVDWADLMTHVIRPGTSQEWYEHIFRSFGHNRVCGEVSPNYAMLPVEGIRDILALNPNIKIVLMLRDPIARAQSHLRMIVQHVPAAASFLKDIVQEPSFLGRSRYECIVRRWQQEVSDDQLFIGSLEELERGPDEFSKRLASFMHLDSSRFNSALLEQKIHATADLPSYADYSEIQSWLEEQLGEERSWMKDRNLRD